jgi:hypothetical protein
MPTQSLKLGKQARALTGRCGIGRPRVANDFSAAMPFSFTDDRGH